MVIRFFLALSVLITSLMALPAQAQTSQQVIDNLLNQVQPGAAAAPGMPVPGAAPAGDSRAAFGQTKTFESLPSESDLFDALMPSGATKDLTVIPRQQQRAAGLMITFDYDSADLTPDARRWLDRLGAVMRDPRFAGYRFELQGHTDAAGSYEYNDELSLRRAVAVGTYLHSRFGVNPALLEVRGYGKRMLHDPGRPYDRINRQVKIAAIGRAG